LEIIVAKTAGFCFGVNKAVNTVRELTEKSDLPIYTIGPIIHNDQVVDFFKSKGVNVAEDVKDIKEGSHAVIRAHGVPPEVYEEAVKKNLCIDDATCPYVKKIHKLVNEKHNENYQIIIVGDKNHPEIIGINGWCGNSAYIVDSVDDVDKLPDIDRKICVVAQTTLTNEKWEAINKKLKERFKFVEKYDTICNATFRRQAEAAEIAKQVDMMLVIGGKKSSNTQKLYDICKSFCEKTYKVETSGELPPVDIKNIKKIGVTAGASTPDWIIKEVLDKMQEINKQESEVSFQEAFENSLVTLQTGQIVKGTIVGFNNSEVYVDMGYKSDGVIPMDQFSDDPDFNPQESIKIGDEIEVFVVRVNDAEGIVNLSKKKADALKAWDKVDEIFENKTTVNAKVVEVVTGGLIASANGIRIFIPASQVSDRYVKDLNEYLKKTLEVRIIEFDKRKKKVVGSSRVVMEEKKAKMEEELWNSIEVGKKYTGIVKSLTDFGAFVDIGGVDGLIHLTELSWTRVKHPSQVLKVGQQVEVYILDFDKEKKRISLGYKKEEDNPWYKAEERFKIGDIVKGKVVRLTSFGAFVEIAKGVDGLVHISQISTKRLAKPDEVLEVGQEVEAKIIEVNIPEKRIGLSIKEVKPIDPVRNEEKDKNMNKSAEAANKAEEAAEDEIPSEHKEEMNVTISDMIKKGEADK